MSNAGALLSEGETARRLAPFQARGPKAPAILVDEGGAACVPWLSLPSLVVMIPQHCRVSLPSQSAHDCV